MRSLKFLQLSDLHLDRDLTGGRFRLPYDKARLRSAERRDALSKAMDIAADEKVDIILIPGDFWEEDHLNPDTVPFVMDALEGVNAPVFIAPGNHDYYSPASHYNDGLTLTRYNRKWPPNVHIFKEWEFEHILPPSLPGLSVSGMGYHSPSPVSQRMLASPTAVPAADIHIALFHGSLDGRLPPKKKLTLPFNAGELLRQPFSYSAIGHYHNQISIQGDPGWIRGAYSGSACALRADESGEHGCLLGVVQSQGVREGDLKFIPLDYRRHYKLTIDVTGLDHSEAVVAKIKDKMATAGVKPQDLVLIVLTGAFPAIHSVNFDTSWADRLCWHIRIILSGVTPTWNLNESVSDKGISIESAFRQRMRAEVEQAQTKGDAAAVNRLTNAFYYGMNALYDYPLKARELPEESENEADEFE